MILCLGTTPALQRTVFLDRLQIDAVNRARNIIKTASGKSLNVARVLTTLGKPCLALGFAGGWTGEFLLHDLDRSAIQHDLVTGPTETRICTTILDDSNATVTELVEESNVMGKGDWEQLRQRVLAHLPGAKLLVLSGSLPPFSDNSFYRWCINQAHQHNVECILDASGAPLESALDARPFLVKPNRSELAKTLNVTIEDDASLKSAIRDLIALGPIWALITLGKEGAILASASGYWRITNPPVQAVSAIGSGDAFAAGLAAAISDGQSPPEAVRVGAACAAANAMIPVAGHLRPQDVNSLLPQIKVEPWKTA